jgi:hypothetical protein
MCTVTYVMGVSASTPVLLSTKSITTSTVDAGSAHTDTDTNTFSTPTALPIVVATGHTVARVQLADFHLATGSPAVLTVTLGACVLAEATGLALHNSYTNVMLVRDAAGAFTQQQQLFDASDTQDGAWAGFSVTTRANETTMVGDIVSVVGNVRLHTVPPGEHTLSIAVRVECPLTPTGVVVVAPAVVDVQ